MPINNPFKAKPTLSDLQEENDELKMKEENEALQLSIAQKKLLHKKLQEQGLNENMFSSLSAAIKWLKTH